MRTGKGQIVFSVIVLTIAALLLWIQLKPSPSPPMSDFKRGQIAFVKKIDADSSWYHQADAHGVPYTKYVPMEVAASNATIQELNRVGRRPGWRSLTSDERGRIVGEVTKKSDEARQVMRDSYYTKPFKPDW